MLPAVCRAGSVGEGRFKTHWVIFDDVWRGDEVRWALGDFGR